MANPQRPHPYVFACPMQGTVIERGDRVYVILPAPREGEPLPRVREMSDATRQPGANGSGPSDAVGGGRGTRGGGGSDGRGNGGDGAAAAPAALAAACSSVAIENSGSYSKRQGLFSNMHQKSSTMDLLSNSSKALQPSARRGNKQSAGSASARFVAPTERACRGERRPSAIARGALRAFENGGKRTPPLVIASDACEEARTSERPSARGGSSGSGGSSSATAPVRSPVVAHSLGGAPFTTPSRKHKHGKLPSHAAEKAWTHLRCAQRLSARESSPLHAASVPRLSADDQMISRLTPTLSGATEEDAEEAFGFAE